MENFIKFFIVFILFELFILASSNVEPDSIVFKDARQGEEYTIPMDLNKGIAPYDTNSATFLLSKYIPQNDYVDGMIYVAKEWSLFYNNFNLFIYYGRPISLEDDDISYLFAFFPPLMALFSKAGLIIAVGWFLETFFSKILNQIFWVILTLYRMIPIILFNQQMFYLGDVAPNPISLLFFGMDIIDRLIIMLMGWNYRFLFYYKELDINYIICNIILRTFKMFRKFYITNV